MQEFDTSCLLKHGRAQYNFLRMGGHFVRPQIKISGGGGGGGGGTTMQASKSCDYRIRSIRPRGY